MPNTATLRRMPRWWLALVGLAVAASLFVFVIRIIEMAPDDHGPNYQPGAAAPANDYIPVHRDLSECITSLPKPGCGSSAKSDWAQGALFTVLVLGLSLIGWRIVHAARRRQPPEAAPTAGAPTTHPGAGP